MNFIDAIIILFYFFGLIIIGVLVSRKIKSHEDSVVAGRSFGSFLAGVGKAANLAGGSTSVGGTGYGYTYGISGSWFGIANIICGIIMYPFAPRIWKAMNRGKFTSIGEYLGYRFGKKAQIIAGILNTCAYIGFVAAQIVATATIVSVLLGWNFVLSAIITTIIVILYTILGGLKAVVYTDCLQLGILYLGIVIILPIIAINAVGGFGVLWDNIPNTFQSIGSMGWFQIIGVILIPTVTAPFTVQATYSYTAACKNEKSARNSNIWSSLIYMFPAFAVILIGLCCYVLYPGLASGQDALPHIIMDLLPNGLIGLLLAAILSATMSTSSTCLLCSVNCFLVDVIGVIRKDKEEEDTPKKKLKLTRILIAVIGLFTLATSLLYPNIIELIVLGYAVACGGLLAPAAAAMFSKRATSAACLTSMIAGGGMHILIQMTNLVALPPIFISLPIGVITMIVVSLLTKKPDPSCYDLYFDDEWEKSPKNKEQKALG